MDELREDDTRDEGAALREAGELDAFVAEHDARRTSIGQITFVIARLAS